jgi:hypothetical protein
MNIGRIFSLLLLSAILTAPAWAEAQKGQPIKTTGTIKRQGIEGGFWGIVGDDGQNYDPQNLAPEFQKEGLRVSFEAETRPDAASFHMWGTIVEIKSMKNLGSAASPLDTLKPVSGAVKADLHETQLAVKKVLEARADALREMISQGESLVTMRTTSHALERDALLASFTSRTKPEDSGYRNGTYELSINLTEKGKRKTLVEVRAVIMAYGTENKAMAKPDSWDPVASNGKIEKEVLKAIQEEAKKRK